MAVARQSTPDQSVNDEGAATGPDPETTGPGAFAWLGTLASLWLSRHPCRAQLPFHQLPAGLRVSDTGGGLSFPPLVRRPLGVDKLTSRFEICRNRFALFFSSFGIAGGSCFAAPWSHFLL
jgi:hypothetical protein